MISPTNAFSPYIDGGGLSLGVTGGVALIGTTPTTVAGTSVALTANTTNYVFLNLTSGVVQVNTSGFSTGQYPIATVVTTAIGIKTLTDSRPDIGSGSGSELVNGGNSVVVGGSPDPIALTDSASDTILFIPSSKAIEINAAGGVGASIQLGGIPPADFISMGDSAGDSFALGGTPDNWALDNAAGSAKIHNPNSTSSVILHGGVTLDSSTPTVTTGQLGIGTTTAATATSGSGTLPSQPAGFLVFSLAGTAIKIPYYNS